MSSLNIEFDKQVSKAGLKVDLEKSYDCSKSHMYGMKNVRASYKSSVFNVHIKLNSVSRKYIFQSSNRIYKHFLKIYSS